MSKICEVNFVLKKSKIFLFDLEYNLMYRRLSSVYINALLAFRTHENNGIGKKHRPSSIRA